MLGKAKLDTIEVLISKTLIESHRKFVSVNNVVLWEYNEMKEEIENPETFVEYTIQIRLI